MPSQIDPTRPIAGGVSPSKADLRANLQSAKDEIEALQTGKSDVGHTHTLAAITDAGALAAKNSVATGDIVDGAVVTAKIADSAVTGAKIAAATITASRMAAGAFDNAAINMTDQLLTRPKLKDFSEASTTPVVSAGVLTLDLETGNVFEVTLTGNVTSLVLANPPVSGSAGSATLILKQDATGGRTLAWPGSVRWASGTPPAISVAANAIDIFAFVTRNGGATWYGFPGGKGFS